MAEKGTHPDSKVIMDIQTFATVRRKRRGVGSDKSGLDKRYIIRGRPEAASRSGKSCGGVWRWKLHVLGADSRNVRGLST
jgi:hypothetical protein